MPTPIQDIDFSSLSSVERLMLAEKLWDSVHDGDPALASVNEAIKAELDHRMRAEDAGEMEYYTWEEVKARLLDKSAS